MPVTCNTSWPGPMLPESPQLQDMEEQLSTLGTSDLIEDANFYQDAAIKYQNAYEILQDRYAQQACLLEKASGALHATTCSPKIMNTNKQSTDCRTKYMPWSCHW